MSSRLRSIHVDGTTAGSADGDRLSGLLVSFVARFMEVLGCAAVQRAQTAPRSSVCSEHDERRANFPLLMRVRE
jgi:hypothetical protein